MNPLVTCKSCNNSFTGKFCPVCGEKVYDEHDKTITHFLGEGLHFITHFDGTLLVTLKTIFTAPGKLSTDYCNGIRRRYFKPLSFFLLLVVLYLLFPLFTGLNMPMPYYEHEVFGGLATRKIQAYLQHHHVSKDQLQVHFAHVTEKVSKLLLFIVIPLTAWPLWLLRRKKRPYFFDHLIFATEANSFFIMFSFFIMPGIVILLTRILLLFDIHLEESYQADMYISGIGCLALATYLSFAVKRFYGGAWWYRILMVLAFIAMQLFVILILYRFILFNITMWLL